MKFTMVYLFQNPMVYHGIYHGLPVSKPHGIPCHLPWFTCFKTPWYTMTFTMVYLFQNPMVYHGIYHGLPVSKPHGIPWHLPWFTCFKTSWYTMAFTMVYLFQNPMVYHDIYHGLPVSKPHGIPWHLPWFTCFKTPWYTLAFTMVYLFQNTMVYLDIYHGLPVSKHHGIPWHLPWYIFIRVDHLEEFSKLENIVISGLEINHRKYRSAATPSGGRGDDKQELDSTEGGVVSFLVNKLDLHITKADISACHPINKQPRTNWGTRNDRPNIIVRFVNRKTKTLVLCNAKKLRHTNIYIIGHLTPKNSNIARVARTLKKNQQIASTWTRNDKVFVKTHGSPETAKTYIMHNKNDCVRFDRLP